MRTFILFLLLTSFQISLRGQYSGDTILTWSDEFDGTGKPDLKKWDRPEYNRRDNPNGPDGFWSREDSYLDGNGNLIIRIRQIDNKNTDTDSCDYSVGALRTKGKFEQLYGKYEIRCQLPTQPGWWVAFWMMLGNVSSVGNNGVDGSEIDIMEGFGWTDKINHAIHYDGYGDDHKSKGKNQVYPGIREGFHTFSVEWTPEMYYFYVDNKEVWRTTGGGVCNQPGYIKVTGEISTEAWAINEWWANRPETVTFPDSFVVDYVRVYSFGDFTNSNNDLKMNSNDDLKLYPNPVDESFVVLWAETINEELLATITISNLYGQIEKNFGMVENRSELVVDDLKKGVYILSVKQNGKIINQKLIKN